MSRRTGFHPLVAAALALLGACGADEPAGPSAVTPFDVRPALSQSAPSPAGLATITAAGNAFQLYPYTLVNFSDAPADRFDPINLVFTGAADPRQIRADLMALDGSRPGFPA